MYFLPALPVCPVGVPSGDHPLPALPRLSLSTYSGEIKDTICEGQADEQTSKQQKCPGEGWGEFPWVQGQFPKDAATGSAARLCCGTGALMGQWFSRSGASVPSSWVLCGTAGCPQANRRG